MRKFVGRIQGLEEQYYGLSKGLNIVAFLKVQLFYCFLSRTRKVDLNLDINMRVFTRQPV